MDTEMTVAERRSKRVEITAETITLVVGVTAGVAALSLLVPGVLWWIQTLPLIVPGLLTAAQLVAIALAAFVKRGDLIKGGFAILLVLWVPLLAPVLWLTVAFLLTKFS